MQPILVPITSNTWSYKCFPFNSTKKKAQTWSHGVKTWMCSWQVYNVRDPSILGQPPNWGSLVVGAASILGTSKNAEKKGGRAGRVLSEAAHLFAIPLFNKKRMEPLLYRCNQYYRLCFVYWPWSLRLIPATCKWHPQTPLTRLQLQMTRKEPIARMIG